MDLGALAADAHAVMTPAARAYVERGMASGATGAANVDAWQHWRLRPHVLHDVGNVNIATTVVGLPVDSPIVVAPTAMHRLVCVDAELATARACATTGSLMIVSMVSSYTLEEIAAAAPTATRFAQMYMLTDRGKTRALAQRAAASGCAAIVASVDGAAVPYGTAMRANGGIDLPDDVTHLADDFDPSVTFDDLALFGEWSGLPVVVKGVLRGDDARRCVEAGASAIAVSNHGGRIVDGCVDTATALVDVVQHVQGGAEIYVDGGLRTGVDVLRALALGADAVLLGRPVLWGLARRGEAGVADVLSTFAQELRRAMAFCGAADLAGVTTDLVVAGGARLW